MPPLLIAALHRHHLRYRRRLPKAFPTLTTTACVEDDDLQDKEEDDAQGENTVEEALEE